MPAPASSRHVDRAARLVAVHREIDVLDAAEGAARKHGVAEFGAATREEGPAAT
jgi:hypothetical protein